MPNELVNISALHRKTLEYKRQNLWIINIGGLDAYTAQSMGRPNLSLGDQEQVNYVTTYSVYQAGRGKWQPVDLTLNDPINPNASKQLYDLIQKQWDWRTGRSGAKFQYAQDMKLKLLAPDFEQVQGNEGVIEIWTLKNAFFSNVNFNGAPLDYDSTARLKIDVTLNYDAPEIEFITQGRYT